MDALWEYLRMGGYAWFVWPSYALSVAGLAWVAVASARGLRAERRALDELRRARPERERREGGPAKPAPAEPPAEGTEAVGDA